MERDRQATARQKVLDKQQREEKKQQKLQAQETRRIARAEAKVVRERGIAEKAHRLAAQKADRVAAKLLQSALKTSRKGRARSLNAATKVYSKVNRTMGRSIDKRKYPCYENCADRPNASRPRRAPPK